MLSRSPAFRALLAARALSVVGDGAGTLALVVHVQSTEGTGTAVGLLLLVAALPRLLSPLAGTVADRVDRRRVLIGGELAQGALLLVAVVWLPPLAVLMALLLAKATVVTIAEPAATSAVPALVAVDDLVAANSLVGALRQAGEVLGPVLGGVVVAWAGVRAGLAVDALTFVASVPLLLRVPRLPPDPDPDGSGGAPSGIGADALAGLRYTLGQPVVRIVFVGFLLVGLSAADDVALPFLATGFGAGERGIGALYAAVGAGLILGYALLSHRRSRAMRSSVGFVVGATVAAAGNLLTGVAPAIAAAVAFQVLRGVGLAVYETTLQTLLQRTVPSHLLGRVFSNVYGAVNLGACVALLAAGPLLDATSARTVLFASGAVGLAAAGVNARLLRPGADG